MSSFIKRRALVKPRGMGLSNVMIHSQSLGDLFLEFKMFKGVVQYWIAVDIESNIFDTLGNIVMKS